MHLIRIVSETHLFCTGDFVDLCFKTVKKEKRINICIFHRVLGVAIGPDVDGYLFRDGETVSVQAGTSVGVFSHAMIRHLVREFSGDVVDPSVTNGLVYTLSESFL